MYSFFVLGLVPGTNFQITFQVCIDALEVSVALVGMICLYKIRHPLSAYVEVPVTRQPLHAKQLHRSANPSGSTLHDLHEIMLRSRKVMIERSVRFYQEHYPPLYEN
jgi:hypothetical protein